MESFNLSFVKPFPGFFAIQFAINSLSWTLCLVYTCELGNTSPATLQPTPTGGNHLVLAVFYCSFVIVLLSRLGVS